MRIRNNREFFNVSPEEALDIFREVALLLDDAEIEETYKESLFGNNDEPENKHHKTSLTKTPHRAVPKTWIIPANPRYFDIAGCLNKHGVVYWRQHFNFLTGDTIYIYVSTPECAIKYKCIVEGHDLPFSNDSNFELDYFINPNDYENSKMHNRFMKLKLISSTNSNKLTILHLLENGMKGAPQGCLNLSKLSYKELLNYIESNF